MISQKSLKNVYTIYNRIELKNIITSMCYSYLVRKLRELSSHIVEKIILIITLFNEKCIPTLKIDKIINII